MICYKDMTFCSAKCFDTVCRRRWTPELAAAAREWWKGDDPPVAFSDFSLGCEYYTPKEAEE